jgi:hypothetical protein
MQSKIDKLVEWVNNLFRSILGFYSANEIYNQYTQTRQDI